MPFAFDLESLRKEHECVHYFETGLWDPRTDVSSKQALRSGFDHVFCIEAHPCWIELGKVEFAEDISKDRYHLVHDDSKNMRQHLSHPCFKDRCLFFLDAHVDNDQIASQTTKCPLLDELDAIQCLERNDHVILIDDLRILSQPNPWGESRYGGINFIEKIKERIQIINPNYQFKTLPGATPNDILCAYIPIPSAICPDYDHLTPENQKYLPCDYEGEVYRISTNWFGAIPLSNTPQRIMEIGAYHGGNVCSLTKTYASHPESTIHCVDPWYDYKEYSEYKQKQHTNYKQFILNISKLQENDLNKIHIHRGLSEHIVPRFDDNSFDIIYIDGNHDKRYVLHDAIMSLKKIKNGGYIIFDDMQCEDVHRSVQIFVHLYSLNIEEIKDIEGQVSIRIKKEI
jgi:hypothetical protein